MRGSRLRLLFGAALASSIAAGALALACSGGDDANAPTPGAGTSVPPSLVVDSAPPPPVDAEVPPGDVCGDRSGLQPASPWPLRGGCATRAARSSMMGPRNATVSVTVPLAGGESSPAVVGPSGFIWVGTEDGSIVAINSGTVQFARRTGGAVRSSPVIDTSGTAIVAGGDGVLYGLSPATGEPSDAAYPAAAAVFKLAVGPMSSSPVIGGDRTIYIGTLDGRLVAVPPDGSAVKWSATTNDTAGSSPAIGQDGTIYVGSTDHKLYAVTPEGSTKWALDLGAEVRASPAVGGDGTVYIGTFDGKLHGVTALGVERWSYATGGAITGSPAVHAGIVYIGSEDKKLHAVGATDGAKRWIYDTLGAVATPVIASDGTVYVGSTDARVYAISSRGTLVFAVNVKGKVRSAPAIVAGPSLLVATETALVSVGP